MKFSFLLFFALFSAVALAQDVASRTDLVWYPDASWVDSPDPSVGLNARKGGTCRFSGGSFPKSLNAYIDGNSYSRMMFDLMYDTLLSTDSTTLEFRPSLASKWAVSNDGRTFVFVLDERAKWSDGKPITSDDVKWTFDIVMDPASDTGPWKTMLGTYESPKTPDARTVIFSRKGDAPKNWRDLANCAFFNILPRHAFEGQSFNKVSLVGMPVSSAYKLLRIEEQVESEYRRVSSWWKSSFPSAKGMYNFDRILLRYHADVENGFEALKKRIVDVYPVYSARIMNDSARGRLFTRNWILKRRVVNRSPIGFQGFAMNMRRPPFDKLKIRQAMALLLDRETMNRTMMNGEYFLLKSYYTDLYDEKHQCKNTFWPYDPARAKKLLAEAGVENGFSFTFLSRSSGEEKFLSRYDAALKSCGIKMEIVRKDFAGWMRDIDEFNFDMTWAAWGASVFRDPESSWHSGEGKRRGGNNITGLSIEEVDRIIAEEKGMMDVARRDEAYRRIDKLVSDAVPYVLLWHTNQHRLLYWNKFGMPESPLGQYGDERALLTYWWYDSDRVEELESAVKEETCLPMIMN